MTDIVERLECNGRNCCLDAKAEIERLRADNASLRAALQEVIDAYTWWCEDQYDRDQGVVWDAISEARAALEEGKDD